MIIISSNVIFKNSTTRILISYVYDEVGDRFVKTRQKISAELLQGLSGSNPIFDIYDIVNLDHIEKVLDGQEIEDLFEITEFKESDNSPIVKRAQEFIKMYTRDKKINTVLNRGEN